MRLRAGTLPRPTPRREAGISLLEVLAALVILSLGASVTFTWLGQSVNAMGRLKNEEASLLAQNEAMEYLRSINPAATPAGEMEMSGYRLAWTSTPVGPMTRTTTPLGTPSRYEVSLHELDVKLDKVEAKDLQPWVHFQMQLAGYKQVAGSSMSIFGASGTGTAP